MGFLEKASGDPVTAILHLAGLTVPVTELDPCLCYGYLHNSAIALATAVSVVAKINPDITPDHGAIALARDIVFSRLHPPQTAAAAIEFAAICCHRDIDRLGIHDDVQEALEELLTAEAPIFIA